MNAAVNRVPIWSSKKSAAETKGFLLKISIARMAGSDLRENWHKQLFSHDFYH